MIRWISREEFEAGERINPYGAGVPAELWSVRAVPEAQYHWLALGLDPYLISAAARRLRAPTGQVWLPDASLARQQRCRLAFFWVLLLDACAGIIAVGGSGPALLMVLVLSFVALPIVIRAGRRGISAWIDYRTGLVGVEDGLSRGS